MKVRNGGLVVVQLREGEGWVWVLAGVDGYGLEILGDTLYLYTPKDATTGTRAFQLRAMETGDIDVWFELRDSESPVVGNRIEYRIRVVN